MLKLSVHNASARVLQCGRKVARAQNEPHDHSTLPTRFFTDDGIHQYRFSAQLANSVRLTTATNITMARMRPRVGRESLTGLLSAGRRAELQLHRRNLRHDIGA